MAWRVAISVEDSDAWRDFSAAVDELPVLPFRKVLGDASPCGLAAFGQLVDAPGLSPELVLDAVRHKLGVGERWRVGPFLHQTPDVVRMEMRDEHGADVVAIDARRL